MARAPTALAAAMVANVVCSVRRKSTDGSATPAAMSLLAARCQTMSGGASPASARNALVAVATSLTSASMKAKRGLARAPVRCAGLPR